MLADHFCEQALSKVTSTGAMTFSFIQAIERGHAKTYGDMLTAMRSTIRKTDGGLGGAGTVTSLITMLMTGGSLGSGLRQVNHYCCHYNIKAIFLCEYSKMDIVLHVFNLIKKMDITKKVLSEPHDTQKIDKHIFGIF